MDSRLRLADAGSVDRDPGGRPSDRSSAVLARKRQPQHGSSETLAAALLICPRAYLVMVVETLLALTSTAAEYVITANGPHIKQEINGYTTIDYTETERDETLKEGVIGLQLHTGAKMRVEFKDIEIAELP